MRCPTHHRKLYRDGRRTRCLHFGRVLSVIVGPDPDWSKARCFRVVWFGRKSQ